ARQVGADVELEAPDRLLVVHVVEGRDLAHRDRWHAEVLRHRLFGLGTDPALLLLHDGQARHHGRLLLVGRVLGDFACEALGGLRAQLHRSTSPNTMSIVPRIATASAIMWPRLISS